MEEEWLEKETYFIRDLRFPNGMVREVHKPAKEELLEQYPDMQVQGVLKIDILGLYREGAEINSWPAYVLRSGNPPVQVLLAEGTDRGTALFYIQQAGKLLEEDWYRLDEVTAGSRPRSRS